MVDGNRFNPNNKIEERVGGLLVTDDYVLIANSLEE